MPPRNLIDRRATASAPRFSAALRAFLARVWFCTGIASPVDFDSLSLVECGFHAGFASAQNTMPSQAARVMKATTGTMIGTQNDPVMPGSKGLHASRVDDAAQEAAGACVRRLGEQLVGGACSTIWPSALLKPFVEGFGRVSGILSAAGQTLRSGSPEAEVVDTSHDDVAGAGPR